MECFQTMTNAMTVAWQAWVRREVLFENDEPKKTQQTLAVIYGTNEITLIPLSFWFCHVAFKSHHTSIDIEKREGVSVKGPLH